MKWLSYAAAVMVSLTIVSATPIEFEKRIHGNMTRIVQRMTELQQPSMNEISKRDENNAPAPIFEDWPQFTFPAQLAQAVYCNPAINDTIGDATILWTAGNGESVPHVYVAYSPTMGIIVAHQGTNSDSVESIWTDLQVDQEPAIGELQYLGANVRIHSGFQKAWQQTFSLVFHQVMIALVEHPGSPIFTVGHSLGAAISLLDALALKRVFDPQGIQVTAVGFGMPRVGNQAFANAVDTNLPTYHHITHYRDVVPQLPPPFNYQHPSGEIYIWIRDSNSARSCPGQENYNCIAHVPIYQWSMDDHTGIYFNVHIAGAGGKNCPAKINAT